MQQLANSADTFGLSSFHPDLQNYSYVIHKFQSTSSSYYKCNIYATNMSAILILDNTSIIIKKREFLILELSNNRVRIVLRIIGATQKVIIFQI